MNPISIPGMMPGMGPQISPEIIAAIMQHLQQGRAMGGGMAPGMSIFGPKSAGPMQSGVGALGAFSKALPWIGLASGALEGIGQAQQQRFQNKEQSKRRRLDEFATQSSAAQNSAQMLQLLMRTLGGAGLYGR